VREEEGGTMRCNLMGACKKKAYWRVAKGNLKEGGKGKGGRVRITKCEVI
jgi:hypothetical protein